jgi:hypothetical protein
MNVPWENFDLSELTYPKSLTFFFDRPVVDDDSAYELFRSGLNSFDASNPGTVVAYLQEMCRNYSELAKVYSSEQLDQGLWAVFGAGIDCQRYLFDAAVQIGSRIECIESMYLPFRDVVARSTGDIQESIYWMRWDMILHSFDPMPHEYEYGYLTLTTDQEQMIDAIYHTLARILAINHRGCQWCALHGLGHLFHPLKRELVQRYLNEHLWELSAQDVSWIEAYRDSSAP